MAEELGAGYVSLIPSARNLSKLIKAELKKALRGIRGDGIEVPVIAKLDQKGLDAALRKQRRPLKVPVELDPSKGRLGRAPKLSIPTELDEDGYQRGLAGMLARTTRTVKQRIKVETDVDRGIGGGAASSASKSGGAIGELFLRGFGTTLLNPLIGIPAIVGTAMVLPLIAGAAGAAILGGAGLASIFVGAFALRGDTDLQKAGQGLLDKFNGILAEAAKPLKGPFLEALDIIGDALDDIAPDLKDFFKTIADSGAIQEIARGLGGFLRSLSETGALDKLAEQIGPALIQFAMALPDIGNGVSQLLISVAEHGPEISSFFGTLLRFTADLIRLAGDFIAFWAPFIDGQVDMWRTIATWVDNVLTGFGILIKAATGSKEQLEFIKKALGDLVDWARRKWNELWTWVGNKVTTATNAVTTTIKGLPDRIKTALGDLGGLLFGAGRSVVQGLINGIKDKLGPLASVASTMAGVIWNHMQHSPAKEGPLAGRGNTYYSGQAIAQGLASGVQSQLPVVRSAADRLAGQFGPTGPAAASASATAGGLVADWAPGSSGDPLLDALKEVIRIRFGGSPQAALAS